MSQYKMIFTDVGLVKKQNAELNNDYVNIVDFAVGSGTIVSLESSMQALISEEYRAAIGNADTKNATTIFDLIVPSDVGGFYIREVALFDIDGDCIMIGTVPETYKVNQDEGSSKSVHLRVSSTSQNTENIHFTTDDGLVYATVSFVNIHINDKENPHEVTKQQLGLGKVENTEDSEKNVANALKLDGKTIEQLKAIFFPSGIITKFAGTIASIPQGFYLCNGENGTPDLRNKFIYGASVEADIKTTGGSADAVNIEHTHSASTNTAGNHSHTLTSRGHYNGTTTVAAGTAQVQGTVTTSTAGNHSHTVTIDSSGESGVGKNLPPYMKLAYIMKG